MTTSNVEEIQIGSGNDDVSTALRDGHESEVQKRRLLARIHFTIGKELYQNSKYKEALEVLVEARNLQESSFLLEGGGNNDERTMNGDLADIYSKICQIYCKLQDWNNAIAAYRSALRISYRLQPPSKEEDLSSNGSSAICWKEVCTRIRHILVSKISPYSQEAIDKEIDKIQLSARNEQKADILKQSNDYQNALSEYLEAIELVSESGLLNPRIHTVDEAWLWRKVALLCTNDTSNGNGKKLLNQGDYWYGEEDYSKAISIYRKATVLSNFSKNDSEKNVNFLSSLLQWAQEKKSVFNRVCMHNLSMMRPNSSQVGFVYERTLMLIIVAIIGPLLAGIIFAFTSNPPRHFIISTRMENFQELSDDAPSFTPRFFSRTTMTPSIDNSTRWSDYIPIRRIEEALEWNLKKLPWSDGMSYIDHYMQFGSKLGLAMHGNLCHLVRNAGLMSTLSMSNTCEEFSEMRMVPNPDAVGRPYHFWRLLHESKDWSVTITITVSSVMVVAFIITVAAWRMRLWWLDGLIQRIYGLNESNDKKEEFDGETLEPQKEAYMVLKHFEKRTLYYARKYLSLLEKRQDQSNEIHNAMSELLGTISHLEDHELKDFSDKNTKDTVSRDAGGDIHLDVTLEYGPSTTPNDDSSELTNKQGGSVVEEVKRASNGDDAVTAAGISEKQPLSLSKANIDRAWFDCGVSSELPE